MVRFTCKLCGWQTLDERNIVYASKSLKKHFEGHVARGEMVRKSDVRKELKRRDKLGLSY